MPSILSNFKVSIIEPLRMHDQFLTSANKPLLITGVNVRLGRLNDAFWNRAWEMIPDSWKDERQFDDIRTFYLKL